MGKFDTLTKKYMSNPDIFADAFNYLIYNGRQVIKPEALRDADATEVIVAYGANEKEKLPVQKNRDNLQVWAVKCDDEAKYVLLGSENQSKIHFAMPVRNMLYDSINYAAQVDAAHKSYKCLNTSEDGIKIELTSEEFLSGFRKDDKLIPVITAVILFNNDEWDAPTSIHEMIDAPKELLPFIADYKLNLISPQGIDENDFTTKNHQGKFSTGFGTLMQIIKHQNERIVNDIIQNAPIIDSDSADMIEEFSNVKFKRITDDKGGINMCKGMELCLLDTEIKGSIKTFRSMNLEDEEIAKRVAELFNVTTDYVKELMIPEAV
jgi:hypothetical protein